MDPLSIALMAVNVGASVFNNLRNNKQSRNLQIMQQEYTKAAAERNTQRMWQLMREGQELAIELERESQDYRLEEIAKEFDNLLERMTYSEAIKLWPLKVLPIVMKNQSLGSAIGHRTEHIALHCILTPTNCDKFNKVIFPDIEEQLSDFFNLHWSNASSHPILFYSGAWKSRTNPTGVEIKHLSVDLSKLPVLLITPFFKPEGGLVFQIRAWGIGIELDTEIECSDFSYAEKYKCGINYQDEKDIAERTIEEFVPYLQCLIGYIADQYFWACHNESPLLPTLLTMNIVNTDGMPYLKSSSEERYTNLLEAYEKEMQIMPFAPDKILSLFEGSMRLYNKEVQLYKSNKLLFNYLSRQLSRKIENVEELCPDDYQNIDAAIITKFIRMCPHELIRHQLKELNKKMMRQPLKFQIKYKGVVTLKEVLENACVHIPNSANAWHLIHDRGPNYSMIVSYFSNGKEIIYQHQHDIDVYFTQQFVVPLNLNIDDGLSTTIKQLRDLVGLMP